MNIWKWVSVRGMYTVQLYTLSVNAVHFDVYCVLCATTLNVHSSEGCDQLCQLHALRSLQAHRSPAHQGRGAAAGDSSGIILAQLTKAEEMQQVIVQG